MPNPLRPLQLYGKPRPAPVTKALMREFVDEPVLSAESRFGPRPGWRDAAKRNPEEFNRFRRQHFSDLFIFTRPIEDLFEHLQSQIEANQALSGARFSTLIDSRAGNIGKTQAAVQFVRWYITEQERALRQGTHPWLSQRPDATISGGQSGREPALLDDLRIGPRTASVAPDEMANFGGAGLAGGDGWMRLLGRDGANDLFLPAAYAVVPEEATPTAIVEALLRRFYGAALPANPKPRDLPWLLMNAVEACGTTLIVIDDVHKFRQYKGDARRVSSLFNFLSNILPVMFLYAGIECEQRGFFSEGTLDSDHVERAIKTSTAGRVSPFLLEAFEINEEWQSFLLDFEEELVLLESWKGMLAEELAEYIHWRTAGVVGAVVQLLTRGALRAIAEGKEWLDEPLLDGIRLDKESRGHSSSTKRPPRSKTKRKRRVAA